MPPHSPSRSAVAGAVQALRRLGVRVPRFKLIETSGVRIGGSQVIPGAFPELHIGRYPTGFLRRWIAMHELGHVLWFHYHPLRRKAFRMEFGEPEPADYQRIYRRESWKTASTHHLSWFAGPHRPKGQPSWYGARAGGAERFCELLGLMHANKRFGKQAPPDLEGLWDVCLSALSRMT